MCCCVMDAVRVETGPAVLIPSTAYIHTSMTWLVLQFCWEMSASSRIKPIPVKVSLERWMIGFADVFHRFPATDSWISVENIFKSTYYGKCCSPFCVHVFVDQNIGKSCIPRILFLLSIMQWLRDCGMLVDYTFSMSGCLLEYSFSTDKIKGWNI